jgi:hypothetical protein
LTTTKPQQQHRVNKKGEETILVFEEIEGKVRSVKKASAEFSGDFMSVLKNFLH